LSIFHVNKIGLSSFTYENGSYSLRLYVYTKKQYPIGQIDAFFHVEKNKIDYIPVYYSGQLDENGKNLFLQEALHAPFAMFEEEKEAFLNDNWFFPKIEQYFTIIKKISSISSFHGIDVCSVEENVINFSLNNVETLLFFTDEDQLYVLDPTQKMYIKINNIPFYEEIIPQLSKTKKRHLV